MKKIILISIVFSLLFVFSYQSNINSPLDKKGESFVFTVEKGEGVKKIGENLKQKNLIRSEFYYQIYVWKNKLEKNFQAGDYTLSSAMSMREIVEKLTKGEAIGRERNITIIEGWSIRDINDYLAKEKIISYTEFFNLAIDPKNHKSLVSDYDFLADKPLNVGLEGYLFPDTYRIFHDASLENIMLKMLDNFDKKLSPELRAEIKKQNKTIYEILIMASLIEKEVRSEDDMKIVSGIFGNRLKNNQRLESCATLAYILGVNKAQYTIEDTQIKSPYNTYQNAGLPPGPICNPGLKAIEAAIYPTSTKYNYFLTEPKEGKTIFSETYNEHLRNKNKHLR